MKTIITTVGVSLLENYEKSPFALDAVKTVFKEIKPKPYADNEWKFIQKRAQEVRMIEKMLEWAEDNEDASAEIKSLLKIKERVGDIRTILVTSDTLKGYFAGEILEELLSSTFGIPVDAVKRIEGLDVRKTEGRDIQEGFDAYIHYLLGNTYMGMGYNISGGYKAIIPISTLIASWKSVPLYYIYEDSDYLVEIPPFPFQFDISICRIFQPLFEKIEQLSGLEENDPDVKKALSQVTADKKDIFQSLIIRHEGITLSTVGHIVWHDYKQALPIELLPSNQKPEEKRVHIAGDHHGKDILRPFAQKLCRCKYIEEIISSTEFHRRERNLIHAIDDNGLIKVVMHWTDDGYGLLVKTTGRNKRETEAIAKILQEQYDE